MSRINELEFDEMLDELIEETKQVPLAEKPKNKGGRPKGAKNKTNEERMLEALEKRDEAVERQIAQQEKAEKRRLEKKAAEAAKRPPSWRFDPSDIEEFDKQYAVAQWWKGMQDKCNAAFLPLFFVDSRYLVLKGGAGSGKSIFVGQKICERVTTEEGHRVLVCRKVARTLRQSCFAQIVDQLSRYHPDVRISKNQSDMVIKIEDTGSEILFAGLDDTEKLKSIYNITDVWIEEASEVEESDFLELDRRMRADSKYYKQMIISFNPVSITHWLKKRFWDTPNDQVVTHSSTFLDNRFLPEEDKKVLMAYKDHDPYHYQVYCLGEWGVTGMSVFDQNAVNAQLQKQIQPKIDGYFDYDYDGLAVTNWRFIEQRWGFIKLYKLPEDGVPYVIGADTAGDGSDYFVAQVIDNRTGEQVAVMRHQTDEDLFTKQLFCLGKIYNDALVGIEVNLSTYATRELQRLNYPHQYVRETPDDYRGTLRHSYGFRTTHGNRKGMIWQLVEEVREDASRFVDEDTLNEMITFVRDENMKEQADAGAHDDCVMALAIAFAIRGQQTRDKSNDVAGIRVSWTEDMYEDYWNAPYDQQVLLLQRWGNPF